MNLVRLCIIGTVVFVVTGVLGTATTALMPVFVVVSLVEFAAGTIAFGIAFLRAVERSRTDSIGIGGLFFASGCAPRPVQTRFMVCLAAQVVTSIVFASLRLYTAMAFGVLAPMWALGLTGMWTAAHGTFGPRSEPEPRGRRGDGGVG
jgi:hypothetical protein